MIVPLVAVFVVLLTQYSGGFTEAIDIPYVRGEPASQQWNVTWGETDQDSSYGVAVASDGVYMVGWTMSFSGGSGDFLLVKYDSDGNQMWNTTWGEINGDWGQGVAVASDGVYVVGYTNSFGAGLSDAFLLKYDFDGNQLWVKTWGGGNHDYGNGVAVTDGGVYMTGYTRSFGAGVDDGSEDPFLVKYDSDGNQLWNTTWEEPSNEDGFGVAVAGDGVYVAGHTLSVGAGSYDALLVKYDSDGNQLWNTTWGGASADYGRAVVAGSDGVYLAGYTDSFGAGYTDSFVTKYDPDGNQMWNTTWGGGWEPEHILGAALSGDGVYVVGKTYSFGAGRYDAFLIEYDSDGHQLWNTTWGGDYDELGFGVAASGGDVYVSGETDSFGEGVQGWSDAFLVKYSVPAAETFELNIAVEGNGTTNPASGTHTYENGTSVVVESFPDEGWLFNHWELDGNEAGPGLSYNVTMDSNHTLTAVFIHGQTQLWNTTWGENDYDVGYDVAVVGDVVYVTGDTPSYGVASIDVLLIKYDSSGHQLWNTTWGGASGDYSRGLAVDSDEIYVIGHTESYGAGSRDVLLIKYDSSGNQLWNTTWGGPGYEIGYGVAVASNGIYVTGFTDFYGAGSYDTLLIKYDSSGHQLWNTTWGGPSGECGYGVAVVGDDVYVTGDTESYGAGSRDVLLIKYDSSGHQLWNTTWGGPSGECGYGVAVVGDDVYVTGDTESYGAGSRDVLLIKYDSSGHQLWNTTWGGADTDRGLGVDVDSDGIYVAGNTDSYGAGDYDAFLVKYDSDGHQLWNTTWGGVSPDYGYGLAVASDGIYVTGDTQSFGEGSSDAFLVKYSVPAAENYELNIAVEGNGTTNPATGTHSYENGTIVTVESFPDEGWLFNHWELDGDEASPGLSYNLTMDSNHTLTAVFLHGQNQLWNTTWGGEGNDYGSGLTVAGDGIYVSGSTQSYGAGGSDVLLAKYDSDGHQLWSTTWGGTNHEYGAGLAVASDGVYVSGDTQSYGAGSRDALLIEYDSDGNQMWNTTWGGAGSDRGYDVDVASDGVYLTGSTDSYGAGMADVYLVKYDSDGNQLWNITWGGALDDYGNGLAVASDGIYVTGYTDSFGGGEYDYDVLLIKYDSDGNEMWNTTWGGANYDLGYRLTVASDGVYATGTTYSYGAGTYDAYLIKYDSDGNQMWNTTWGGAGTDRGCDLDVTSDGVYVAGHTDSYGAGAYDAMLTKYDSDGNQMWNTTWGGAANDICNGLAIDSDGIYVSGYTQSYGAGDPDVFMVKYSLPQTQSARADVSAGDYTVYSYYLGNETSYENIGWVSVEYHEFLDVDTVNLSVTVFAGDELEISWDTLNLSNRSSSGMYWPYWFETNITLGEGINFLDGVGNVTGSTTIQLNHDDFDCWVMEYQNFTVWIDVQTGVLLGLREDYDLDFYNLTLISTNVTDIGESPIILGEPYLSVVPDHGFTGTELMVTGYNFTPWSDVLVTINGSQINQNITSTGSFWDGSFRIYYEVPVIAVGNYSINALDETGRGASVLFSVVEDVLGAVTKIGVITPDNSTRDAVEPLVNKAETDINQYMEENGYDATFEFIFENADGQANIHLEKVQSFRDVDVNLLVAGAWSSQASASLEYINEMNMLILSPTSTAPLLAIPEDNLFRLSPSTTRLGPVIAETLASAGIEAIVIMHTENPWGNIISNYTETEYTQRGGHVDSIISYPGNTTEFSSYLTLADDAIGDLISVYGVDHVGFLIAAYSEIVTIATEAEGYPSLWSVRWFGSDASAIGSQLIYGAPSQADHLTILGPYSTTPINDTNYQIIDEWYESEVGGHLDFDTAAYYDACWVLALSAVEANSSMVSNVKPILPTVAADYEGVTGLTTLDDAGDRDAVNYDIWGYGYVNETPSLIKYGYYNCTSGEVQWIIDLETHPEPVEQWNVTMTVNASGYTSEVTFGVQDGATDLFDFEAGDKFPSPDPPIGVSAYFHYPDNPPYLESLDTTKLSTSLIPVEYPAEWTLKAKSIGVSGTAIWHWNASDIANIPSDLHVTLVTPSGSIDMRSTDQCQGMSIDADTTYTFTITVASEVEYTMELRAGWNMVSLPVVPDDELAANILDGVGFYQLVTWSGSGYYPSDDFEAGKGYWLLVLVDVNVTVSGPPVDSLDLSLSAGWNMVGGTFEEVQAADVFPGFYQLVTWTGTGYTPASVFEPGRGYWALVLSNTEIELNPN